MRATIGSFAAAAAVISTATASANAQSNFVGWGAGLESLGADPQWGQALAQVNLPEVAQVAAGEYHTMALTSSGLVVVWGKNHFGQCDVPANLGAIRQIAAGESFCVALRMDGTVAAWGANDFGQCNVPTGLSGVTMVEAGNAQAIALKSDGTVTGWGNNSQGQLNTPAGLSNVTQVDSGANHMIVRRSDGTARAWGDNIFGQCNVPASLSNVTQVAGGGSHSVALRSDGSVSCWGNNGSGQCSAPPGLPALSAVSAGGYHTVALSATGTVYAWGGTGQVNYGQAVVPSLHRPVTSVSAGGFHSVCTMAADCNNDGIADAQQLALGELPDYNGNNIPDCCEAGTPCKVGNYPVQWRVEDGGNGHWYAFDPVVRDWTAAMQSAQLRGAHGATIHSSAENEFVFALAELCCNAVWLGGRGVDGACSNPDLYYWVTGEPMTYQSWLAGEPNGQHGFSCALSFHPWYPDSPSWNDTPIAPEWIGPTVIEWSADCNSDGIVDYGQILSGQLVDADNNGIPDSCEVDPCPADVTRNQVVDGVDLAAILGAWGTDGQNQYDCDIDDDGVVSGTDLAFVLGGWGPCQ